MMLTRRYAHIAAFALGVSILAAGAVYALTPARVPPIATVINVAPRVARVVTIQDDAHAGLHGAIGQIGFWQEPRQTGPSPDRLDFTFDAPAEVLGIMISIDVPSIMPLVEVAAGVNADSYDGFVGRDWLIHTSSAHAGEPSRIDEHAWFPVPFVLEAGDRVSVVAWVQNAGPVRTFVSPEVIVYYQPVPSSLR